MGPCEWTDEKDTIVKSVENWCNFRSRTKIIILQRLPYF